MNPAVEEVCSNSHETIGIRRRRRITRTAGYAVAVALVLIVVREFVLYLHDEPLRQRLIGKWTMTTVREDGSVLISIWEFRRDGTARDYLVGKPTRETGRVDDYMQWNIKNGELIMSCEHLFTREATVRQRLLQIRHCVKELWRGSNVRLRREDRCAFHGEIGESVTIVLIPAESEATTFGVRRFGYMPERMTLTRVPQE